MEARRQPLEAHRRDVPVAVAARAIEQVDVVFEALDKGPAQLRQQLGIVSGRSRERRVEGTDFVSHAAGLAGEG